MKARAISGLATWAIALTAACIAGPVFAQQQGSVARLTGVQGNVLVSQTDGMAAAANGQKLAPGVRIITTAGAKATVTYDKGCTVNLGENRRYTVREQAECATAKAPPLGVATGYAVLGGVRVDNVGQSVIRGNLGVSPGTGIGGFPQGRVVDGEIQPTNALASQAQRDVATADADLAAQTCNVNLTGQDLGGQTLTPGVYCFPASSAQLTGELVLDAQGDANAVFVFKVGTTLSTAPKSAVRVINGESSGDANLQAAAARDQRRPTGLCYVYWLVGESATLGKESTFIGTIIARASINASGEASVYGRALARTGLVALDTNAVEIPSCFLPLALAPGSAATVADTGNIIGLGGLIVGGVAIAEAVRNQPAPQPISPN